jgi:hypothetical protein
VQLSGNAVGRDELDHAAAACRDEKRRSVYGLDRARQLALETGRRSNATLAETARDGECACERNWLRSRHSSRRWKRIFCQEKRAYLVRSNGCGAQLTLRSGRPQAAATSCGRGSNWRTLGSPLTPSSTYDDRVSTRDRKSAGCAKSSNLRVAIRQARNSFCCKHYALTLTRQREQASAIKRNPPQPEQSAQGQSGLSENQSKCGRWEPERAGPGHHRRSARHIQQDILDKPSA